MANSVDPDQTPLNAASDLGLHCLLRCVCSKLSVILVCRQTTKVLMRLTEYGRVGLSHLQTRDRVNVCFGTIF